LGEERAVKSAEEGSTVLPVLPNSLELLRDAGKKPRVCRLQTSQKMETRDCVRLEGRGVERRFPAAVPVIEKFLPCCERAEGDVEVGERFVEDHDIRRHVCDKAMPSPTAGGQGVAADAGDHQGRLAAEQ